MATAGTACSTTNIAPKASERKNRRRRNKHRSS